MVRKDGGGFCVSPEKPTAQAAQSISAVTCLENGIFCKSHPFEKKTPEWNEAQELSIRKSAPRVFFFMLFVSYAEPCGAKGRICGRSIPQFAILLRIL
jgi:hypothetical protein